MPRAIRPNSPFSLAGAQPRAALLRAPFSLLRPWIEAALRLNEFDRLYDLAQRDPAGDSFPARGLRVLDIQLSYDAARLAALPKSGPLLIVANHPFGGVEGLALSEMLRTVRPDVRLLVNFLLGRMPEMRAESILVDPFGDAADRKRNLAGMREALRWLRDGGALAVFPAGAVAHRTWRQREVVDPPWNEAIARLALRSRAAAVPVFFPGQNDRLFQLAGMLHPLLRTALLPRAMLRRRGTVIRAEIGSVIPAARLARFESPAALCDHLRLRTYVLAARSAAPDRRRRAAPAPIASTAAPDARVALAAEVERLGAARRLCAHGPLEIYCAPRSEAPATMLEIGRLRERTFRLVGEGTGADVDLDRFDDYYLHLFGWNRETREVFGAYRLGPADQIVAQRGAAGLYTHSLFRLSPRLLAQLGPALELGRSFVVPEYQRNFASLMLLWKGIGHFVAREPRYRFLFGAVSISDEYQSATRQMLMAFLMANRRGGALADLVRPRCPPKLRRLNRHERDMLARAVHDMDDVEELVAEIEANARHVPVLLRQYLKLNGKLLAFNTDRAFSDVIDGLMLVDLLDVDRQTLRRYLGDGCAAFLRLHGADPAQRADETLATTSA